MKSNLRLVVASVILDEEAIYRVGILKIVCDLVKRHSFRYPFHKDTELQDL